MHISPLKSIMFPPTPICKFHIATVIGVESYDNFFRFALIFSKCAILLGSAIYFFIEVFVDARMFLFFMTELLFGISGGIHP